jgi:hypothetical protein
MSEGQLSEEQLRALEAEMEKVTVDDVLLQTIVTLINLGARKSGLARAGAGGDQIEAPPPDLEQLRQAIEGARALLPLVEQRHADKLGPVRDSLSQLQMVYAQKKAGAGAEQPQQPEQPPPGQEPQPESRAGGPDPEAGPAQKSGRLWVPGQ